MKIIVENTFFMTLTEVMITIMVFSQNKRIIIMH